MKKLKISGIVLFVLLAGAATWFFAFRKKEKPISVLTQKPGLGYISRSVTATGTIQPVDTVSVGTQVSGTIKSVYADFNSTVKKGQLVAELDKSLLQAQVDQIQAGLQAAQSQFTFQTSNFGRQKQLFDVGAISKADYETAENLNNSAKSNVNSLVAQLQAAKKNLSYAEIYSPINGVVLTRNVSIGQTVASSFSTPTLFIIAKDITKMQVQAAVDEADIGNVATGQRVSFTVDAYPDDVFAGTVEEIRLKPTVSANVVTYTTIINAPNDNLKLKPGMTANIIIYTKEDKNVLLIPAKALQFTPTENLGEQFSFFPAKHDSTGGKSHANKQAAAAEQTAKSTAGPNKDSIQKRRDSLRKELAYVWVRVGDSLIEKRIRAGLNDDKNVEVLSGLTEEDDVVYAIDDGGVKTTKGTSATKSPFMPQRPRGGSGGGGRRN